MLKGGEKRVLCIWLKVWTILSVKPINDFVCEGFCKFTVYKGVIYGVWLTTVNPVTVCIYPISEKFFLCNDNSRINLNWNSFNLFSLHVFETVSKTSVQFTVSIEISLSHLSGPVWGNWYFLTRSSLLPYTFQNWFD